MSSHKVFRLKCTYQTYAWGKLGASSEVAKLLQSVDASFVPSPETAYAELWMGTHPNGPSVIEATGETLEEWIRKNPESLGLGAGLQNQLPYLFKVLSVNVALSIQVHPDKPTAEKLHKSDPKHYGDNNHKPEMAIALSKFEALCGFRPYEEIVNFLKSVVELREIIGADRIDRFRKGSDADALKDCFSALMSCEPAKIETQLKSLVRRLQTSNTDAATFSSCLGDLVLRLDLQFPGDVGCFCVYFMNYIILQPGEAIFLKANLPHAYLSGDCMECMACSDNVVRAGLTPKFKDVQTLCNILEYKYQSVGEILFTKVADPLDPFSTVYDPPVSEFTIASIQIPAGVKSYTIVALDGASILIVLNGSAEIQDSSLNASIDIKRGSVIFLAANVSVLLKVFSLDAGVTLFRAYSVSQ